MLPRTMNNTMEISMKVKAPPGIVAIQPATTVEKPDWVMAQDMPVAAPMISSMAPDSDAVRTSIGITRDRSN